MRAYTITPNVFTHATIARMNVAIEQTPLVGRSPLAGTFESSRGFGAMFRMDGLKSLEQRLPFVMDFFEAATRGPTAQGLFSWRERLLAYLAGAQPNAFYLNVLAVPPGKSIGAHIDATLRTRIAASEDMGIPKLVSVLYLKVPSGAEATKGQGCLRLFHHKHEVAQIEPEVGAMVHFRGHLAHEVRAVAPDAPGPRLSMVCEQYVLDATALQRVPQFALRSQGLFAARLKNAASRTTPQWLAEGIERTERDTEHI